MNIEFFIISVEDTSCVSSDESRVKRFGVANGFDFLPVYTFDENNY